MKPKAVFVDSTPDFTFVVKDEGEGLANLHCWVDKWSPRVLRNCYRSFVRAEEFLKESGFTRLVTVTPNPKFAKLFGGSVEHSFYHDGIFHEVIIWDLH